MTETLEPGDGRNPLLFDALLTPHRSLSPRGFVVLMAAICAFSFSAGLGFFLAGAWPVVGFLGLDVLLVYVAFRVNFRHGRMYETLRLNREALTVRRVDHWGKARRWLFQPTWLQVLIDDPPRHESQLTLRSHGRSITVGAFLTPAERLGVAKTLRRALAKAQGAPE